MIEFVEQKDLDLQIKRISKLESLMLCLLLKICEECQGAGVCSAGAHSYTCTDCNGIGYIKRDVLEK